MCVTSLLASNSRLVSGMGFINDRGNTCISPPIAVKTKKWQGRFYRSFYECSVSFKNIHGTETVNVVC